MQEVKTFKTSSAETLHRECKISSTKHFLVHFSLNYHDILVKSLGAYYTPELRFFSRIFRPKVATVFYIRQLNYEIENYMSDLKKKNNLPTDPLLKMWVGVHQTKKNLMMA